MTQETNAEQDGTTSETLYSLWEKQLATACIYDIFNSAVTCSGYIMLNYGMVSEEWVVKGAERNGYGLIWDTVSVFAWKDCEKPWETCQDNWPSNQDWSLCLPRHKARVLPMKIVRLIKMCLNETYSKVPIGKHLSDNFPIQNGLKQGDALSALLLNFALEQRWPTGGPRAGSGPRLDLLRPPPSHRFIFSGVGVIEGNKIDWWKFKYLLNIIGAT
jgi:hypothetical protein